LDYGGIIDVAAKVIYAAGVALIALGVIVTSIVYLGRWWRSGMRLPLDDYYGYRAGLTRSITLGLEFLVGAGIIRTVALSTTFRNLAALSILVLIRTMVGACLQLEIEGRWPWKRTAGALPQRRVIQTDISG
jgi:uncharacterized membrane protein